MNISPTFVKHVFQLSEIGLRAAGWMKRRNHIFSRDLGADAYGCVGLNKALYRGGILQINPVVSVGDRKVENLIAELSGIKFEPYTTASIGMNIGYLMPENKYVAWSFQDGENCAAAIDEIIATVEKFGRPFIENNATLEAIYNTLLDSKRGTPPDPLDYRIAVALLLLGKRTEAESFVDVRLREIGNRTDAAADWFRNFAAKLRER